MQPRLVGNNLKLCIEDCFKIFDHSFDRLKYFSSISNNVSVQNLPKNWDIQNPEGLTYSIRKPEEKDHQMIVEGYKHFIGCYLLRDCIESFSLALDDMFFGLLLHGKHIHSSSRNFYDAFSVEEKKALRNFKNTGLFSDNGKVQLLKSRFQVELPSQHNTCISSLRDIRNCFAHANGFVRDVDGKEESEDKSKRSFYWQTICLFVKSDSGEESKLEMNKVISGGGSLCLRIQTHSKSFRIGEQLSFSTSEIYEMGQSLQFIARQYLQEIYKKFSLGQKIV